MEHTSAAPGIMRRNRASAKMRTLAGTLLVTLAQVAYGDLPIHATMSEVVGVWQFTLTGKPEATVTTCGSRIPNENLDNLQLGAERSRGSTERHDGVSLRLELSDDPGVLVSASDEVLGGDFCDEGRPHIPVPEAFAPPLHRQQYRWLAVYKLGDDSGGEGGEASGAAAGAPSSASRVPAGYWTMIYDQGFAVRLFSQPLFGVLHDEVELMSVLQYSRADGPACAARAAANSDAESSSGETVCYRTDPGRTLLGWTRFRSLRAGAPGPLVNYGCFNAAKQSFGQGRAHVFLKRSRRGSRAGEGAEGGGDHFLSDWPPALDDAETSFILMSSSAEAAEGDSARGGGGGGEFSLIRRRDWKLLSGGGRGGASPSADDSADASQSLYACPVSGNAGAAPELPSSYAAVANPFVPVAGAAAAAAAADFAWEVPTQGNCGACFALASAFALQARAQLGLARAGRRLPRRAPAVPELSAQTIVSCSFLSQGCVGGFPYSVGKFATELGLPSTAGCMPYAEADDGGLCRLPELAGAPRVREGVSEAVRARFGRDRALDIFLEPETAPGGGGTGGCSPESRVFAFDYGYVGGCYECCSEAAMQREIFASGPIIAAIDAPGGLKGYSGGIFDERQANHSRLCDSRGFNGWEFTNHAIAIVGWGEDAPGEKYWIARNSWGPRWGVEGFFKWRRGTNLNAAEAHAVWIDPDFTRGLLAEFGAGGKRRKGAAGQNVLA